MQEQQFVLIDYADGQRRIAPVDRGVVENQLAKLQPGQQFRMERGPPLPAEEGLELMAINCVREPQSSGLMLVVMLQAPGEDHPTAGYVQTLSSPKWGEGNHKAPLTTAEKALEMLLTLVERGELPDFKGGWQPVRLSAATPEETRRMKAKENQGRTLGGNKGGKK